MFSRIWLSILLTIALTNSASAIVNGPTARGASGLAGVTPAEALAIRQNSVRLIAITKANQAEPFCSGVRLGTNEILSAGHCFSPSIAKTALDEGRIFAEIYDVSQSGHSLKRRVRVNRVEWRQDSEGDLAVAALDGEAPVFHGVPLAFSGCDQGSPFVFGGFGRTEEDRMSSDVRLARYAELSESELTESPGRFFILATYDNLAKEWIVLSKKGVGHICPGDSGGPLFCRSRGRLAVAGITANISNAQFSSGDRPKREWSGSCRVDFDHAVATRLSRVVEHVQSLRAKLNGLEDVFAKPEPPKRDVLLDW